MIRRALLPALAGVLLAPVGATSAPHALGVSAYDTPNMKLVLTREQRPAGRVEIELTNKGEDPHDLVVTKASNHNHVVQGFTETAPGATQSRTVRLRPGRYYLYCTLPGHESQGMNATLRVVD